MLIEEIRRLASLQHKQNQRTAAFDQELLEEKTEEKHIIAANAKFFGWMMAIGIVGGISMLT